MISLHFSVHIIKYFDIIILRSARVFRNSVNYILRLQFFAAAPTPKQVHRYLEWRSCPITRSYLERGMSFHLLVDYCLGSIWDRMTKAQSQQIFDSVTRVSWTDMRNVNTPALNPNILQQHMMTSSNGNIFRVTGPLWGESTGHRWIPFTKASDIELWCFLWYTPEQTVETPVIWDAIVLIMPSLWWYCCKITLQLCPRLFVPDSPFGHRIECLWALDD